MRLFGKRSVIERIKTNSKSIKKIYLQEGSLRPEVISLARKNNIDVVNLTPQRFFQLTHSAQTQGIMAEVDKFIYQDFDEMLGLDDKNKPTLICLDRITDPHNLGVILRNSACFGGFCIILPRYESVEVNETVLKVACGAENHIPVCLITNLSVAIQKAKKAGYWLGATVVEGGLNPRRINFNFPLALLFGSEGEGIRPGLMKHLDYKLTLPMQGAGLSFNVAMAAGIFCYEVSNQRVEYGEKR